MDARNFVGPNGNVWQVYVNGQFQGNYSSQQEAERIYNYLTQGGAPGSVLQPATATTSAANTGGKTLAQMTSELQAAGYNGPWDATSVQEAYTRTVSGGNTTNTNTGIKVAGGLDQYTNYMSQEAQFAQQQYLRDRLNLYDIPMMQQERELALKKLDLDYGALTGWYTMGANGPQAVAAGSPGALPSFTREQWATGNEQWQQQFAQSKEQFEKQFGAQNWQFLANMLAGKSGPRDYGVYSQLQPNAAFGAMTGTPSWEQAFVNFFNSGGQPPPGTPASTPPADTPPATGSTPAPAPTGTALATWQLPQGFDWAGTQKALDAWGNELYNNTGQWPTQEEWLGRIKGTVPGAPDSYSQSLLGQLNKNNTDWGHMGLILPDVSYPNATQQPNWYGNAYSAWAPTQNPTAPVPTTPTAPAPVAAAGTTAYPWPNDPTAWMTGTAKQIPFRQPIDVNLAEWNQWSPTKQQMELGNVSYNGIPVEDWLRNRQAAEPTGYAAPTTTWKAT